MKSPKQIGKKTERFHVDTWMVQPSTVKRSRIFRTVDYITEVVYDLLLCRDPIKDIARCDAIKGPDIVDYGCTSVRLKVRDRQAPVLYSRIDDCVMTFAINRFGERSPTVRYIIPSDVEYAKLDSGDVDVYFSLRSKHMGRLADLLDKGVPIRLRLGIIN